MAECAVWFQVRGQSCYELRDDEQSAAGFAWHLEGSEEGYVLGVQFADGRLVAREQWQALADYETRYFESLRASPPPPVPPQRAIKDPFDGQAVSVDVDEPSWLGAQ